MHAYTRVVNLARALARARLDHNSGSQLCQGGGGGGRATLPSFSSARECREEPQRHVVVTEPWKRRGNAYAIRASGNGETRETSTIIQRGIRTPVNFDDNIGAHARVRFAICCCCKHRGDIR